MMPATTLKAKTSVFLIGALLACFALAACGNADSAASSGEDSPASSSQAAESTGSGSEAAAEGDARFVGTWEMYSISDGEGEFLIEEAEDDVASMVDLSLQLSADGKALYRYFGGEFPGSWEETGDDSLHVEFDEMEDLGELPSYDAVLEDGMLVLEDGSGTLKLKRSEANAD